MVQGNGAACHLSGATRHLNSAARHRRAARGLETFIGKLFHGTQAGADLRMQGKAIIALRQRKTHLLYGALLLPHGKQIFATRLMGAGAIAFLAPDFGQQAIQLRVLPA